MKLKKRITMTKTQINNLLLPLILIGAALLTSGILMILIGKKIPS